MNDVTRVLEQYAQPTPDLLFHYTDTNGLYGILRSRSLWATHFRFLNDATEFVYGHQMVAEYIASQLGENMRNFGEAWSDSGRAFADRFPHFIASTSADRDSLSQWRGYGKKDDSYAIALRSVELVQTPEVIVLPIIYRPKDQREIVKMHVDRVAPFLGKVKGRDAEDDPTRQHGRSVLWDLFLATYSLKAEAFRDEQEWRLVAHPLATAPQPRPKHHPGTRTPKPPSIQYRPAKGQIIPFVEIKLESHGIDHVLQGPGTYPPASAYGIEQFAAQRKFVGVKVEPTGVPLA